MRSQPILDSLYDGICQRDTRKNQKTFGGFKMQASNLGCNMKDGVMSANMCKGHEARPQIICTNPGLGELGGFTEHSKQVNYRVKSNRNKSELAGQPVSTPPRTGKRNLFLPRPEE